MSDAKPYFAPPADGQTVPATAPVDEAELRLLQEEALDAARSADGVFRPPGTQSPEAFERLEKRITNLEGTVERLRRQLRELLHKETP